MLEAATALKNWLKVNLGITLLIAFSHKDWSQRTAHGRTSICQQNCQQTVLKKFA